PKPDRRKLDECEVVGRELVVSGCHSPTWRAVRAMHCNHIQFFGDRDSHPSIISMSSFLSADIPNRLMSEQQEAETSRSTIPSMVTSGSVIGARGTTPFAVCDLPVNCRDC